MIRRGWRARSVVGAEPGARGGARREVLDEHVGAREDALQQRRVVRLLDVERPGFLAAVEPDEVGAPPWTAGRSRARNRPRPARP